MKTRPVDIYYLLFCSACIDDETIVAPPTNQEKQIFLWTCLLVYGSHHEADKKKYCIGCSVLARCYCVITNGRRVFGSRNHKKNTTSISPRKLKPKYFFSNDSVREPCVCVCVLSRPVFLLFIIAQKCVPDKTADGILPGF